MKYLLDIAYILALILISPKIIYRMIRHGRYRSGLDERLGKIRRKNPDKKCIWIHAVSVGEVNATKTIVAELKKQLPDLDIAISATTDTGRNMAEKLYGTDHCVFYFPFDISFVMSRAFKKINPAVCVLMELEIWPNMAAVAKKKNIPLVVANGRISDRSFPRYKKVKPFVRRSFRRVSLFLAQTQEYADRFIAIGGRAERTIAAGNLKYDTAEITDKVAGTDELKNALCLGEEKLFVAGGTGNGEEKIILEMFKTLRQDANFENLKLAIVPRKPERFDEVAELIKTFGFSLSRYSNIKAGQPAQPTAADTVILGDTMGDLRKFYCLADLVFVGRTLVPMGGSDMLESAALGKCTIFGPHTFNFKQTVKALLAGNGAIEVANGNQLLETTKKCLTDENYTTSIASAGQNVIRQNQGTTKKIVDEIKKLCN